MHLVQIVNCFCPLVTILTFLLNFYFPPNKPLCSCLTCDRLGCYALWLCQGWMCSFPNRLYNGCVYDGLDRDDPASGGVLDLWTSLPALLFDDSVILNRYSFPLSNSIPLLNTGLECTGEGLVPGRQLNFFQYYRCEVYVQINPLCRDLVWPCDLIYLKGGEENIQRKYC